MNIHWRCGVVSLSALLCLAIVGCSDGASNRIDGQLLAPQLSRTVTSLKQIELVGAENKSLVKLKKQNSAWWVSELDWPANAGKVAQLLDALTKAKLEEAKTKRPERYQFLGLEDLSGQDAQGIQLQMTSPEGVQSVLLGKLDAATNKTYVRLPGNPQTWRLDRAIALDKNPYAWLQQEILTLPSSRISLVRVKPSDGQMFSLAREGDHFVVKQGASTDPQYRQSGDELVAVLQDLSFDEFQTSGKTSVIERELEFLTVDGLIVKISAWRMNGRFYIRLDSRFDERVARDFFSAANKPVKQIGVQVKSIRDQSLYWNRLFKGRQFLLPNAAAAMLMRGRQQLPSSSS